MSGRGTKGNGKEASAFGRLTRADLVTFDREATDLVMEAIRLGCVGRVSSRGHAILRNNSGGSVCVPRTLSSPNRSAQNARASVRRLLAEHRRDPVEAHVDLSPRRMTVSVAFIKHGAAFARWFDGLRGGLPADQILEVSFDEEGNPVFQPAPSVEPTHAAEPAGDAPAPGKQAEDSMTAIPDVQPHEQPGAPTDAVLTRERSVLGEDPRIAVLERRVADLEAQLAAEKRRADEAHARLRLIEDVFHS